MPSTLYINANELPIAQRAAATVFDSAAYETRELDEIVRNHLDLYAAAEHEAEALLDRPEYLINLLSTLQVRDRDLASCIEHEVVDAVTRHRRTCGAR